MSLPVWPEWKTVREIGRGSFGGVYEIEKEIFGDVDKAALKVITIPQSSSDIDELINEGYDQNSITDRYKSYLEDIVKEYKLMAELKGCNNIVHCDDLRYIQHEDGIGWDIYIKMELLIPLSKAYKTPVDEQQVIKLGIDMCNALIACKKKNIIHRDIKPQNIFVSEDGTFKLGDFGIAKTAERTTGGTKTGTYKYMAPEVYNNQPYGSSSDLYSLGMVMYWMLNDRRAPFLPLPPAVPTAMSDNEALLRRMNGEKFPAPANGGDLLKSIVMKACEHDPSKRFMSPDAMRNALMSLSSNNNHTGFTTSSAPGKQAPAQINNEGTVGMPWAGSQQTSRKTTADNTVEGTVGMPWANSDSTANDNYNVDDKTYGFFGSERKTNYKEDHNSTFDINIKLNITPKEAAQGCQRNITNDKNEVVPILISAGVKNGSVIKITGAGKQNPSTGGKGDAYVEICIIENSQNATKKGNNFNSKTAAAHSVVISTAKARKGGTKTYIENSSVKTITIPAGCQNQQIVDSTVVYVHDMKMSPDDMRSLPTAVVREYANRSTGALLWSVVAFFGWMFFGIATMMIPIMALGLMVSVVVITIRSIKIKMAKDWAKEILLSRKEKQ